MGMTRDELFDAFSRFLAARSDVQRADLANDGAAADGDLQATTGDAVVAERAQPAKAHAKAKPKKRR
jgi:hypothetical protein